MPRVSVITGAYNVGNIKFAEAAVISILNQSFSDFEFIICNDGSTDDTGKILLELAGQDSRVMLIENKANMGLAYTLNHCLEIACGEYIARMDMDDISYPNRFEEQVSFLDSHPDYMAVGSWADLFSDDKNWGLRKKPEFVKAEDFLMTSPMIHPSVMMRRDPLLAEGCYSVREETKRAEDYELFMRLYAKGYGLYNIQKPLIRFREDISSYSRRSYRYRLGEAKIRAEGFNRIGLLPKAIPYVIKPLIVGLIPQGILRKLRHEGTPRNTGKS